MPYNYDLKNAGKQSSNKQYDLRQFAQKPQEPTTQITPIKSSHFAKPLLTKYEPRTGLFGDVMSGIAKSHIPSLLVNAAEKVGLDKLANEGRKTINTYDGYQAKGAAGKVAEFVGEQLPMLPAWAAGEGIAAVGGKILSKAPIVSKLAPKLPGLLKAGLSDATAYGTAVAPLESIARGEDFNQFLDREKTAPLMGAGGMIARPIIGGLARGAGLALKGTGKAIGRVSELHNTPSWGKLGDAGVDKGAWNDVVSAYSNKGPSLRDVKQAEYDKLFSNLNADVAPVRHTNLQQGIDENLVKPPLNMEQEIARQADLEKAFPPDHAAALDKDISDVQNQMNLIVEGIASQIKPQNEIGSIWNTIKARGGIAPSKTGALKGEYSQDVPVGLRNKNGLVIDELADEMGMTVRELLDAIGNRTRPKTKSDMIREAERAAANNPEYKALSKTLDILTNERKNLPLPQIETPVIEPLPQRQLPTPERLTWTNKDVLSSVPKLENNPIELPRIKPQGNKIMAAKVELPEAAAATLDVPLGEAMFPGKNIDFEKFNDVGNLGAYTKDVYRIFRQVFGKDAGNEILLPFDRAKEAHIDMQNDLLGKLKSEIVDKLGIKKGSKESALVQQYGERTLDQDALALFQEGKITPEQLQMLNLEKLQQLAPEKWQKVVDADNWFRKQYDDLIEQINTSRREIYPNAEANAAEIEAKIESVRTSRDYSSAEKNAIIKELENELEDVTRNKIIPKRNDYYRHFQEMTEGFKALKNIFDSPAQISTDLIGTSEFTKPKSKWTSIAQKRTGNQTEQDAVGGFLNYVPAASYATHIDPQIAFFRGLERALKDATRDTHNVDTFIGFLDKYAGHLAGKTNPLDRVFQDMVPGGRKTFSALNWLNSRIKANTVLGKASSALAQLANIPTGIAFAKQYSIPGMIRSLASISGKNPEMAQSAFLKERFGGVGGKMYRQFDESLLSKPKEMAVWLMETADKIGTTFIWNSAYTKGLAQGVADPIRYADMATRDLVAGRGVGEVPIMQQSKLFQLIAPFQLEVGNLWHIQKDFVNAKDFGGLVALYFLNYGFNEMMKATRGSGVVFDPIGAAVDASSEKDMTPAKFVGRVGGEMLSNVPMGQTFAAMYPENGMAGLPGRKELFGRNDPTRFGSSVLVAKGLQDPLFKIIPPFGGDQVKKFLDGQKDLNQGAHLSGGKLAYPVSPTLPNQIKGSLFGASAFTEAQDYYNNNRKPLSDQQTQDVMKAPDKQKAYQNALTQREIDSLSAKIGEVKKNKSLTKAEQNVQIRDLQLQQEALKRKLGR